MLTLFVLLNCFLLGPAVARAESTKPNIIFALIDDLGWNGMGFHHNNTEVKTPFLDDLAYKGVILNNYYVYKFCSPSRASFLTGRIPGHGIWEMNPGMTSPAGINPNMTMIPAMLKKAGYATHQVGKWHQGYYQPRYLPVGRGFDTSFGFLGGGEDHFNQCNACANSIVPPDWSNHSETCLARRGHCDVPCPSGGAVDLWENHGPATGKNGTYNPYAFNAHVNKLIADHDMNKPFFMYYAIHDVHQPVEADPFFLDLYPKANYNTSTIPRRVYNGMHSAVDSLLKNMTEALKAKGMWNNTIIVFSADNGGTFEHGMPVPGSSNWPLRGHKYSYFEGGINGASWVHSPLLPSAVIGTTNNVLLHISDWYPTFCHLAGVDPDDGYKAAPHDGINAWPIITGAQKVRPAASWKGGCGQDELIYGIGHGTKGALRQGDYKLIVGGQAKRTDGWSAQYPGSTPIIPAPRDEACRNKACLFNVDADYREMDNLADKMPERHAKMLKRYHELAENMNVPNSDGATISEEEVVWDGYSEYLYTTSRKSSQSCQQMHKNGGIFGPWETNPR